MDTTFRLFEATRTLWRGSRGWHKGLGHSLCGTPVPHRVPEAGYGGQAWHEHCFLCSGCEQPLGSQTFVPDKGAHYCVPCYENKFAPRCFRKVRAAWSSTALRGGEQGSVVGGLGVLSLPLLTEAAPTDADTG